MAIHITRHPNNTVTTRCEPCGTTTATALTEWAAQLHNRTHTTECGPTHALQDHIRATNHTTRKATP